MREFQIVNIEESFFKVIFNQYYRALCLFADKMLQDWPAAEDLVENVFIKLWEKEPDFSQYKNIKAVLYISVKNACINFIRKRRNSLVKQDALSYLLKQRFEDFILNEITRAEVLREVYAELQKLPPERREVMNLLFVEGWDSKKVASHLNISINTVKKHKLNGIHNLQKKFGIIPLLLLILTHHY